MGSRNKSWHPFLVPMLFERPQVPLQKKKSPKTHCKFHQNLQQTKFQAHQISKIVPQISPKRRPKKVELDVEKQLKLQPIMIKTTKKSNPQKLRLIMNPPKFILMPPPLKKKKQK